MPRTTPRVFQGDKPGRKAIDEAKHAPRVQSSKYKLLKLLGEIQISGSKTGFVVKDKFVMSVETKADALVGSLRSNFIAWFFSESKRVDIEQTSRTILYARLRKASTNTSIITELGGEGKVTTTLFEMFSLVEKQKHGEDGVLCNNGFSNIFYILDTTSVLRLISVDWFNRGWVIRSYTPSLLDKWMPGRRVFFPK